MKKLLCILLFPILLWGQDDGWSSSNPPPGESFNNPFLIYLTLDGAGSTSNMAVDGSSVNKVFSIAPSSTQVFILERIIVYVEDNASLDSGGWGALGGSPLGNGFIMRRIQGGDTTNIPITIKSNGEMSSLCYDVSRNNWGAGNEFVVWRLSFNKFSNGIKLKGSKGDKYEWVVRDDIDGLVAQYIVCQGYIMNTGY